MNYHCVLPRRIEKITRNYRISQFVFRRSQIWNSAFTFAYCHKLFDAIGPVKCSELICTLLIMQALVHKVSRLIICLALDKCWAFPRRGYDSLCCWCSFTCPPLGGRARWKNQCQWSNSVSGLYGQRLYSSAGGTVLKALSYLLIVLRVRWIWTLGIWIRNECF